MASCEIPAYLVLEDGQVFEGVAAGVEGVAVGLLSVETGMTGYQELLSDSDSAGKLLVFTASHIGNCGRTIGDSESVHIHASGLVVRELSRVASNHGAKQSLKDWLIEQATVGISEVDTRAVTRYLRERGAMRAAIVHGQAGAQDEAGHVARAIHALGLSHEPSK